MGTNPAWRGRQTLCQQVEPQQIESEHLRSIRTASSLNDFYRLLPVENRPSMTTGNYIVYDRPDSVCLDNKQHRSHRRQCQNANPISRAGSSNYFLDSNDDAQLSLHQPTSVTHASKSMRRDSDLNAARRRTISYTSQQRRKQPNAPNAPKVPHQCYSAYNNRLDAEMRLDSIERVDDNSRIYVVNDEDDEDYDDDDASHVVESLEWYIRLASRCYRDGFKWHADNLQAKATRPEARQVTRRPLQLIVERFLQQQDNEREGPDWCSGDEVAEESNFANNDRVSTIRSTTPENNRSYEIRIDISHAGVSSSDKYHWQQNSDGTIQQKNGKCIDRTSSETNLKTKNHQHLHNSSQSTTQLTQLIDNLSTLNLSVGRRDATHRKSVPHIVLTDCYSSSTVLNGIDDDDNEDTPTSTSLCLLTPPSGRDDHQLASPTTSGRISSEQASSPIE